MHVIMGDPEQLILQEEIDEGQLARALLDAYYKPLHYLAYSLLDDTAVLNEDLIAAVQAGDAAEVGRLVEAGANPDAQASQGKAVLALAARDGQLETVQHLLEAGADPNSTVATGSLRGRISVAGLNESALSEAVINNHLEVVDLLIASGADVDHAEDNMKTTALQYAAIAINPEAIKILLEHGADPNLPNNWKLGYTALHFAVKTGPTTAAKVLLEGGADANAQTEWGMTPMMTSLVDSNSQGSVTTLLLEHGADPNIGDTTHWEPRSALCRARR